LINIYDLGIKLRKPKLIYLICQSIGIEWYTDIEEYNIILIIS